ncbi:type I-F CRISPR-associated helicase Cas3 [Chromobacterium violaceum]|uniref:type I-F CRISPR-associated helicase Cas3f n=1 Tax=Chromobacterium violaceum TaxID=536 RepID=UPI0009D9BA8D|nr:type I-F CRISPR-associated helicase Cas3f [Chromobacterium violaceum]OQS12119.1 type I-F CRISPR-associated helicase Cas3 [Chromobacterium violaceum]OQS28444.1 type I-F CRISPR-associated helicase Cas3 [Chromobacterium violaceum]
MNILLISQCDKRALTETRRILDQFAERRGDCVWQTPITQAGLDTLRRLLRKTARKNTAVACHWIRGRDHSELLWIVGDARRFNLQGAVPTNATQRDVLRADDENDWLSGEDIRLISGLAALLHDLGKACSAFQVRLRPNGPTGANLYRHEWVSLRLFQAFVGDDDDAGWLSRLQDPTKINGASWIKRLKARKLRDGLDADARHAKPFAPGALPPLAAALCWLVLSHHRLPQQAGDITALRMQSGLAELDAGWNQPLSEAGRREIETYWTFPYGLPCDDALWRDRTAALANELLKRQPGQPAPWLDNAYLMHASRLLLMLADHHFSSQTVKQRWQREDEDRIAFANTLKNDPQRRFNQTLPEHLTGVARHALAAARALPGLARELPALGMHKVLRQRSADPRFRWQDKAFDLAAGIRDKAAAHGAFIVNLASTGCGKTLANARLLYALANPAAGLRCAYALGLRALTLQTGLALRDRLRLDDGDLAIRVGGAASRELFEHYANAAEQSGSESSQALLDEDSHIRFDGNPDHPLLQKLSHDPRFNALLAAPVLVCTVDHLTPATESARGGRQIAPMLRLMSSDIALDEIDDYSMEDLPALTRLVHWAGLLGSRVLLSSATLPPALVSCLFDAYLAGRRHYQANRGQPGLPLSVCCLWVDENDARAADCAEAAAFAAAHLDFARPRAQWLAKQPPRRAAELLPLSGLPRHGNASFYPALAERLREGALRLHRLNAETDPASGKRVSVGLIRIANIDKLYRLAQAFYALGRLDGVQIHLCVYHAQYPLLLRSAIERRLDAALSRHDRQALFRLPDIRQRLDANPAGDQLFIALSSPVSEVGRDHCYSWAIAEPSSMRSLIQLTGRVRRHWTEPYAPLNLLILQQNIKSWLEPDKAAYLRPGFETEREYRLDSHDLAQLLREDEYRHPDACPRLLPSAALQPKTRLADLEHVRLNAELNGDRPRDAQARLCAASCWQIKHAMLHAGLLRRQPFRDSQNREEREMMLLPNEEEDDFNLVWLAEGDKRYQKNERPSDYLMHRISDEALFRADGIMPWGNESYLNELERLAAELELPLADCARRFGCVSLPFDQNHHQGWRFHPALGFCKV